jgi:hypothetical protein
MVRRPLVFAIRNPDLAFAAVAAMLLPAIGWRRVFRAAASL